MWKRYRVLLFALLAAALAVPFEFAPSLESSSRSIAVRVPIVASTVTTVRVFGNAEIRSSKTGLPLFPESAQLIVAGGILFGIAAVLRGAG